MNTNFTELRLSNFELERLRKILSQDSKETGDLYQSILTLAADFKDGFAAEIRLCTFKGRHYIHPVLINDGNKQCLPLSLRKEILGHYEFRYGNTTYVVEVRGVTELAELERISDCI